MFKALTRQITRSPQNSKWANIAFVGVILSVTVIGFIFSQHEILSTVNTITYSR